MSYRITAKQKKLRMLANDIVLKMLTVMPDDINDEDYGYVIARVNLDLAHSICKLHPTPEEE